MNIIKIFHIIFFIYSLQLHNFQSKISLKILKSNIDLTDLRLHFGIIFALENFLIWDPNNLK